MRSFLLSLVVIIGLTAAGTAAFIWSGAYNVAANAPHWEITHTILEEARERSVAAHSKGIAVPPLDGQELISTGFHEYHEMCQQCHGGPGHPRESFAMGMYPMPPDLASGEVQKEESDAEIFWIVKNGFKMTGMPAFGAAHDDQELWGVIAFLKRLPKLKPQEYDAMVQAEEGREGEHSQ